MFYGNFTEPEEHPGVWSDYLAVWHLNETVTDESSLADAHTDSTGNGYTGDQTENKLRGPVSGGKEIPCCCKIRNT